MTKTETIKILTLLSAFYGEGKAEAEIMAAAWHELLAGYDYYIVRRAVMNFAKADIRHYAAFPTPGTIIAAVEAENAIYNRTFNSLLNNADYKELPERAQAIISKIDYDREKERPYEEKLADRERIIETLKTNDLRLWNGERKLLND